MNKIRATFEYQDTNGIGKALDFADFKNLEEFEAYIDRFYTGAEFVDNDAWWYAPELCMIYVEYVEE